MKLSQAHCVKTPEFGKAFEHLLVLEGIATQSYGAALERLNDAAPRVLGLSLRLPRSIVVR